MSEPKMAKIALMLFGYPNYPNDVGLRMAEVLCRGIEKKGIDVVFNKEAITDPREAQKQAVSILSRDVSAVIVLMGTWVSPEISLSAILELKHLPILIWGFGLYKEKGKMESTGSFVALNVIKGCLDRMDVKYKPIFADVDNDDGLKKLEVFCRAAATKQILRRSRLGLVGYSAMNIYPGTFDHALMRAKVGPEIVQIDTYALILLAEKTTGKQRKEVIDKIKSLADIADDVTDEVMNKAAGIYIALKELVKKYQLDGINVKCQTELSQMYGCIACIPTSMLADDGVCTSCEGDVPLMVSMAILQRLSGRLATYGDVLDIRDGRLFLSSCGFAPLSLCHPDCKASIRDIGYPGFKGPLVSIQLKEGKITLLRLVETVGGYEIHTTRADAVKSELRQGKFPAVFATINGNLKEFTERLMANHYAFVYSDLREELLELAKMLNWNVIDYETL